MNKVLKVKLLQPNAIIPKYHYPDDSGFDIGPYRDTEVLSGKSATFGTGIAVELPPGTEIQIRLRSSIIKQGVLSATGTVDEGYRGEIFISVHNTNLTKAFFWPAGTRIAQAVIAPVIRPTIQIVDVLSHSLRGANGFGHTGER